MVLLDRLSEEPDIKTNNNENECKSDKHSDSDYIDSDHYPDDESTATPQEDDDKNSCLDIVEAEDQPPGIFGNIVVKNSSEVHFGNKTFYQGPVTIKQFLYNNSSNNSKLSIEDNDPHLVTDGVSNFSKIKNYENNENYGFNSDLTVNLKENSKTELADIDTSSNGIRNIKKKYKVFALCGSIVIIFVIIFLTIAITTNYIFDNSTSKSRPGYVEDSPEQENVQPIDLPDDPDAALTLSGKLRIISRREWLAQPPSQKATKLKTPVPFVVILHTATENCTDQASCVFHVRYIQTFHIDSFGWWDIGYSFLVGGDGFAYEGRGWESEGAFTYGYNARAIGIAFIGTFNDILPPPRQILAAQQLIQLGVKKGYIAENYKIFAHRQLSKTQSPGAALYKNIKTWPHWSSTTEDLPNNISNVTESDTNKNKTEINVENNFKNTISNITKNTNNE